MISRMLIDHFDHVSEAPDAVGRLRVFILNLAVRGKLVEQDSKDESGRELLKRIQKEKITLIEQGKIRKQRTVPAGSDEQLFAIPENWTWTYLGAIGDWGSGSTPARESEDLFGGGITWLKSGELDDNKHLAGSDETVTELAIERGSFRLNQAGDVLIAMYGATIGKSAILAEPAVTNQAVCGCTPFSGVLNLYLFNFLLSQRSQFHEASEGGAQPNISKVKILGFRFPLPPLEEQRRIVAKIDELMLLCDGLESAQSKRELQRRRMALSCLDRIRKSEGRSLSEAASFYLSHFARLTTSNNLIKELRRNILDLAVRGQLVSQETAGEMAPELLERIAGEKLRLSETNKLRKERPPLPISEEDIPFSLPPSWRWARIGACSLMTEYGTSVRSEPINDGVPVLAMGNIQDGKVILEERKKVPRLIEDLPKLFLKKLDLLYNRTNSAELVGKTGIFLGEDDVYTFASYLIRIRFLNDLIDPLYCNLAMNAPYFRETQVVPELQQQCGQANVNGSKLRNMVIPIPPLAEQRRIVSKVADLMGLCDRLETQITTTQVDRRRLLEATLGDALIDEVSASDLPLAVNA